MAGVFGSRNADIGGVTLGGNNSIALKYLGLGDKMSHRNDVPAGF